LGRKDKDCGEAKADLVSPKAEARLKWGKELNSSKIDKFMEP